MLLIQDQNPADYLIKAFEPGKIKVNDQWYHKSLALTASNLEELDITCLAQVTPSTLEGILAWQPEILLLGTGPQMMLPPQSLLGPLYAKHIGVEFMDSFAACRTFHVLTSEARRVAALILIESS